MYIRKSIIFFYLFFYGIKIFSQNIDSFRIYEDVKITVDKPAFLPKQQTIIILYALPNGHTTAQTMGKKMQKDDDWRYNVQHIKAQTEFIRSQLKKTTIIVCYLENTFKSWPLWKQKHEDHKQKISHIVDTLYTMFTGKKKFIYLNGHSGGGSFIFGLIASGEKIPAFIKRISFLDSNYGYDSSYMMKFVNWLNTVKNSHINIFAYNDSVVIYKGEPIKAATGTWYQSHQMLKDFMKYYSFQYSFTDSIIMYKNKKIEFFLKPNPDRKIYHTQQVELNGFIHSILSGTTKDSKGYTYYSKRSYQHLIE